MPPGGVPSATEHAPKKKPPLRRGLELRESQTLAANLPVEGEVCDLSHAEVSTQTEIDTKIVTLIQQVRS